MPAQVVAPAPATVDEGHANLATSFVALYVFLLFGRILELFQFFGWGGLRLMLPISIVALVTVFLTGNVMRALRTPLGVLLVAWTAWMVVCMPFSSWRSESLSQFTVIWLKSLMVFFIVAGLGSTAFVFRRVMNSMAWAAAAACLLVLPGLSSIGGRAGIDRLVGVGTLSNPNEIAFHLWLGMAFLVALLVRSPGLKKAILSIICLLELAIILKTVSREGLLLALVIVLLTLPRVSFPNKMKIVAVSIVVCVFAAATLSHESLDRYMTVFNRDVDGLAAASAEASSRARAQKLHESIELTVRHPIFGVGMGVFMPASVELAHEEHRQGDWAVSHNAYTQVSSELGVPGLLILLAIYFTAFRQVVQVDRAAKQAGREEIRQIAFTLLLALAVLSVHFCFDSIAYVFYMPLIAGLVAAFALVYAPAELRAGSPEAAAQDLRAVTVAAAMPGAWRQTTSGAKGTRPQTGKSQEASPCALNNPNPYRFGRRRKV